MHSKKALVVVDIQNDFCPGGALGVQEGDQIIPVLNQYVALFLKHQIPVFVSRDWHPKETKHFKQAGGPWPPHCIQGTDGAAFHPDFRIPAETTILSKGTDPDADGYSVFEAHDSKHKSFNELLQAKDIDELYIGGIATDYCVRTTSLDALENSYKVNILTDAIKGVAHEDSKRAIEEIVARNGKLKTYAEVSNELV